LLPVDEFISLSYFTAQRFVIVAIENYFRERQNRPGNRQENDLNTISSRVSDTIISPPPYEEVIKAGPVDLPPPYELHISSTTSSV